MTTPRTSTPARDHGIGSLNAGHMFVLDFIRPVYAKRRGFSDKRAVLKRFTAADEEAERTQRERIVAALFAIVHPKIAPEVQDDDETKGLRIRWINGCKVTDFDKPMRATHLFDAGVIRGVDGLIRHTDRHQGNAMVAAGHIFPIDHEHCLERAPMVGQELWCWSLLDDYTDKGRRGLRNKAYTRGRLHAIDTIEKRAAEVADLLNTNESGWTTTAEAIIDWAQDARCKVLEEQAAERKAA